MLKVYDLIQLHDDGSYDVRMTWTGGGITYLNLARLQRMAKDSDTVYKVMVNSSTTVLTIAGATVTHHNFPKED